MLKSAAQGVAFLAITSLFTPPALAQDIPHSTHASAVPVELRKELSTTDTVLAFKQSDALDGSNAGAVAVVRHASTTERTSNPCDLLIYRIANSSYTLIDKSDKAVDCVHISFPKRAGELDLNDNLTVKPKEVTFFNERERGGQTYVFAYSAEKSTWHLLRATSIYTQPGKNKVDVIELSAAYPLDISWTPMSSFDPDRIADAMSRHRVIH